MALKACKECGKEVSENAEACPYCGVQNPGISASQYLISALVLCCVVYALFQLITPYKSSSQKTKPTRELSMQERYPGPWLTNFSSEITIALAQNQVRGCGEYKYLPSSTDKGEYVVNCKSDGNLWTSYIVWVPANKVLGPYQPDPSLGY